MQFAMRLPELAPANYSICAAVADGTRENHRMQHWVDNAGMIGLPGSRPVMGMIRMETQAAAGRGHDAAGQGARGPEQAPAGT